MARNISNIFSLSLSVRQLMTISNNVVKPIRLFRTSSYCLSDWRRESERHESSDKRQLTSRKQSLIMNKLRSSLSEQEVFHLIKASNKDMDGLEALEILTTLFKLEKKKKIQHNSLSTSKEFSMLCNIIKTNIRQLSEGNAIQALKILNYFRVPTSTVIVQMVLQIIRQSMNNLSIEQILFLIFLMSKCQKTPLIEALSMALPIVLESHIKSQLDRENIDTLVTLLQYLAQKSHTDDSISIIVNTLNNTDTSVITANHAKALLPIITNFYADNTVIELLRKCQQILTDSMSNMNSSDLKEIHRVITDRYKISDNLFYNENFLETYIAAFISHNLGFDYAVQILANFNTIRYTNNSLLDYVATKCFEHKNLVKEMDNKTNVILLRAMSNANYKPVFWESVKKMLIKENLLAASPAHLINTAIYLASLDCYWSELLEKIYTTDLTRTRLSLSSKKKFLLLYNMVKTNHPEYTGPWPSDNLVQMFMSSSSETELNFPLKSALESALGGPQYLKTHIKFNHCYYIDHVIIMRKGGFPIAVNNSPLATSSTIEELQPPENSQVILFICIPNHGYVRNTQRLTGLWSLMLRTLKNQTNYTIIPINAKSWVRMSEPDRVRYISQEIRIKSDEISVVVNS